MEDEGIQKFINSYDRLIHTIDEKSKDLLKAPLDTQSLCLKNYQKNVDKRLKLLEEEQFVPRLWRKDPGLWKEDREAQAIIRNGLGWLYAPEKMLEVVTELEHFSHEIKSAGFKQVVHIGMGGSSLAPLVFQKTFTQGEEGLPLRVLDTTQPETILKVERNIPLEKTLFIIASKSGRTAETIALRDYFFALLQKIKGEKAGENFIAITDPGTWLEKESNEQGFRRIFLNFADIGGRYSALSYFGLVPAALMGLDVTDLLERALRMLHAAAPSLPPQKNPGVILGAALGEMAQIGHDKITFLLPPELASLGMWLEQLLAESTGKEGKGLFPVTGEPISDPSFYGNDRLFVYINQSERKDKNLERFIDTLKGKDQPLLKILLDNKIDIGQEFFRWEIATATAGAILSINAFDQPNVQESKDNTNRLLKKMLETGGLPEEKPTLREKGLSFYSYHHAKNAKELLSKFFESVSPGDYFAIQAFLPELPQIESSLQELRQLVSEHLKIATTLGYGPRYLHSTGQYHKGGPNTGLFLQLTGDCTEDLPIPGRPYSFGSFIRAQALGDMEALHNHNRRIIRVHQGKKLEEGLRSLNDLLRTVIPSK